MNILKSNLLKITVVVILTTITFFSLQTNYLHVFFIDNSLAAAGYHYVLPVDNCGEKVTIEDLFGRVEDGKVVPFSKLKVSKESASIYAFTAGTVTKVEKSPIKTSLWLSGEDGYNYYYEGLTEITKTDEVVKTGEEIGKADKGFIYFGVTRDGYGTELSGAKNIRKNSTVIESGIRTEIYYKNQIRYYNPYNLLSSKKTIRQCGTNPQPNIVLGGAEQDGKNLILNATADDPNGKLLTIEFRIKKTGEKAGQIMTSSIHNSSWPLAKWKKSGSTFSYTFENLEEGVYEWTARAMNEQGIYSHGIVFGTENLGRGNSSMEANAQATTSEVSSGGFALVQQVTVGSGVDNEKEIVYQDIFPEGLKVGVDSNEMCCYAVLPQDGTFKITPNTGEYGIYIPAELTGGYDGAREITVYDGFDYASKQPVYHSSINPGPFVYHKVGEYNYSENQFVTWIDTSKAPWNEKVRNVRLRIKNPENVGSADPTFVIKSIKVLRPKQEQESIPTTVTTQTTTTLSSFPVTTVPSDPSCSFTESSYILEGSTAVLTYSTFNAASGHKPELCSSGGNCKEAAAGENQTISVSPNVSFASTVYTLKVSNGNKSGSCTTIVTNPNPITTTTTKPIVNNKFSTCNSPIISQINDESKLANAITSLLREKYPNSRFLEIPNVGQAFINAGKQYGVNPLLMLGIAGAESSVANRTIKDAAMACNNPFGRTGGSCNGKWYKFSGWNAEMLKDAAAFIKRVYIDKGFTTFDSFLERYTPIKLNENRDTCNCTGAACCMRQAYISVIEGVIARAGDSISCQIKGGQPEKPNNAPNIPALTDVSTSDIITVPGVGADVTLRAVASDPDDDQVSVKFRIYKYDESGKTPIEYCSTMQESDFDEFLPSSSLHTYTFKNLAPGTYKWSAMANDERYRKSEEGSMFCYSSNDSTKPLYGFATARTFTVDSVGTINHRPYIKTDEMSAIPADSGVAVTLNVKGYDDDGDKVQAYYRVREKVTGNCVVGTGLYLYQDSKTWTTFKDSGSEHPDIVTGLKPGTTYQWSVKLMMEKC